MAPPREEEAVKIKWKNLRDCFNREIKKNPSSLTNYTGNWAFFQEMFFTITLKKLKSEADIEVEYLEIHDEELTTELELEDEKPDDYYDMLFLESLAPYFKELDPVRKLEMRSKIQEMLEREISIQNNENGSQEENFDDIYIDENADMTYVT
ncbi:uncharacterized protein LOC114351007 [Ostrinia furnacalis]|uniref:uncharacterized protein LOC114351007 n=1 Tax=Ostrinia furnacalis TaxID=93504 RepID=UPI001038CEBD|nr:uncharacterized protein LOC114351007 [Ostrinia furnacalis]